mmetsp:Transcript_10799/g.43533  ORF Transcript_10799/g.43533 Transcript_10799/m.43533 type:complete len:213 (-) Transcript_10799:49-687(-)
MTSRLSVYIRSAPSTTCGALRGPGRDSTSSATPHRRGTVAIATVSGTGPCGALFLDALARRNGTSAGRSDMPTTAGRPEDATSNPATPVPEPSSRTTASDDDPDDPDDDDDPRTRRRHTSGWETYMPRRIPASQTVNPVEGIGSAETSSSGSSGGRATTGPVPRRTDGRSFRPSPRREAVPTASALAACAILSGGPVASGSAITRSSTNFSR